VGTVIEHSVFYFKGLALSERVIISYLKKVFWSDFFVDASFQIPIRLRWTCGWKLGLAANLNQNPIFEMAYSCKKSETLKQ